MAGRVGGSARREYERRRQRDRERRRARLHVTVPIVVLAFPVTFLLVHVIVGVFNNTVRDVPGSTATGRSAAPSKPPIDVGTANLLGFVFAFGATATLAKEAWGRRATTEAWRVGAEGEERTARRLDRLEHDGYRVLHDARVPGSAANIDHVVVGPSGLFTIETKNYSGKVRINRSLFAREVVATHNGRKMDGVVDQARREAEVVQGVVRAAAAGPEIHVQPIVVIQRAELELGWFTRRTVRGVRICSSRHLIRVIKRNPSSLRGTEITAIAETLEGALLPSTEGATTTVATDRVDEHVVPTCRCGEPMVLRHRRRDGAKFYGCSMFPVCRHTQAV